MIMRIPLTKYGWPQVVVFPAMILAVMAGVALGTSAVLQIWAIISVEVLLGVILIWVLSFFRDPKRICPSDSNLLLAPADGQITDIEEIENNVFLGRAALRIGIFLSIFNTHINRAPCNVKVEKITYKKGKYKNALNPESARVNESNELNLIRTDSPQDRLIVRQISGAIARRIVCDTTEGSELTGGEKFGMLKFGSRTELYVPLRENAKCMVKIGDKVKAGLTPLIKYE
ncbi:MAG: phosphatidylserine decarboxylase family protein [Planctomycetes bacterium]|nr:phosphatidylserine decarboxylase family protein [Planctomycetota bacterium]